MSLTIQQIVNCGWGMLCNGSYNFVTLAFQTGNFCRVSISYKVNVIYVSLRLRVQNAVSAQPCVGKF